MSAKQKSVSDLRKFGLTLALPLAVIGGLLIRKGRSAGVYVGAAAGLLLLVALLFPLLLGPVERVWMAFSRVLSMITTFVILTLIFFLVITPMGVFLKILRRDLLQTRLDRRQSSYWSEVDADGPSSRPDKPY
jgi:hypothetical protein